MLSLPSLAKRFTYSFRPSKVQFDFPFHSEWEVEGTQEVVKILSQPFFFLGKGTQCYVFESRDRQFVIKFFRYDQGRPEEMLTALFNACKLAHDRLKEETGLVYIHLNESYVGLPTVVCRDTMGRKYSFEMDKTRFLIQKKAKGFRQTLTEAKNDPEQMQKRLDEFLTLLRSRTAKGVRNTDPSLCRNFGFLENSAIEVDFGNYRNIADLDRMGEMERFVGKLHKWLEGEAPEWIAYLDQQLQKTNESM